MLKPVVLVTLEDNEQKVEVIRGDVVVLNVDFDWIDGSGDGAREKLEEIHALQQTGAFGGYDSRIEEVKDKLRDISDGDPEDFDDDEEEFDDEDFEDDEEDELDDELDEEIDDIDIDEDDEDFDEDDLDDDVARDEADIDATYGGVGPVS